MFTSFFGVSGWGRVLVPINFRLNADEISYIVEHSGATMLLVDPELDDDLRGVDAKLRFVIGAETDAELYREEVEPRPWADPDENDTATINYTSGTTARPKGVQLTHRNIWLNATVFGWQTTVTDRPTTETSCCTRCPCSIATAGACRTQSRAWGAGTSCSARSTAPRSCGSVRDHGVTLMCGAPAVVAAILDAAQEWDGEIPGRGSTRIVVAGAPPPTRTIERVETDLGWEFIQIYGLTETTPLLTMNRSRAEYDDARPRRACDQARTRGRARARCASARRRHRRAARRGNHVMGGYWQQPEETAKAIADGWFRTGDGGDIDDGNYVSIADRKKDVIISGGENVSSIEVEDCIFSHPAVAEVCVIGVPDEKWGEAVKALVVLAPGAAATEGDLIEHCRSHLAHYKCPKTVDFRDVLDRTATGKLQKFKLRAPYWEGRERQVN